jgi:hypothetical protein
MSTGAFWAARFILEVFAFDISRRNPIRAMELTTILNHCYRHRGFVYQHPRWSEDKKSIEVKVRPRHRSSAICEVDPIVWTKNRASLDGGAG